MINEFNELIHQSSPQHLLCARSHQDEQIQSATPRDSGSKRVTVACKALILLRMQNRTEGEGTRPI